VTARRRIELPTTGTDEFFQLIGSDPYGSMSNVGLRVPLLHTDALRDLNGTPIFQNRYLFCAATYSVGEGSVGRILGYRQLVTIGTSVNVGGDGPPLFREVEFEVTSPFWHFADANVSFHLRRTGGPGHQGAPHNTPGPNDLRNFKWKTSDGPALLYETAAFGAGEVFYVNLAGYSPPNAGKPWGDLLADGHQGTFYDLRTPWRSQGAWRSLQPGVEVEGPDTITAFISVMQTDPESRAVLPAPADLGALPPEERFLQAYPLAIYWRVGFSLIVEIDGQRRPVDCVPDELTGGARRAPP
jgi:hypothetical protein